VTLRGWAGYALWIGHAGVTLRSAGARAAARRSVSAISWPLGSWSGSSGHWMITPSKAAITSFVAVGGSGVVSEGWAIPLVSVILRAGGRGELPLAIASH
jgi:hypothetical protein